MSLSNSVSEDQYDKLNEWCQRRYIYCPLCGKYYLKSVFFYHGCKP